MKFIEYKKRYDQVTNFLRFLDKFCPRCRRMVYEYEGWQGDKVLGYCEYCKVTFRIHDERLNGVLLNVIK